MYGLRGSCEKVFSHNHHNYADARGLKKKKKKLDLV